ncbi:MAG: hypothetical protein AAGM67_05405 [Bacteroidota bacterium]
MSFSFVRSANATIVWGVNDANCTGILFQNGEILDEYTSPFPWFGVMPKRQVNVFATPDDVFTLQEVGNCIVNLHLLSQDEAPFPIAAIPPSPVIGRTCSVT